MGIASKIHFLVATIQVIDVVEHGRPPGTERGDHESRAGSDVGHADGGAVQHTGAGDDGTAALHVDVRAKLAELRDVLEAVFEDGFGDHAASVRLRHQADEGRLQVGWESGMRPGGDVDRLQAAVALDPEAVGLILHLDAGRP